MTQWMKKWPAKPGTYWFYGWSFGSLKDSHKPELHFVEVRRISNGMVFVTNGHFLYKEEGATGMWANVELPELPTLSC